MPLSLLKSPNNILDNSVLDEAANPHLLDHNGVIFLPLKQYDWKT